MNFCSCFTNSSLEELLAFRRRSRKRLREFSRLGPSCSLFRKRELAFYCKLTRSVRRLIHV